MKLKKPTVTHCIDGGLHSWMVVNEDTDIIRSTRWERRWCQKCGVLTQVIINPSGEAVACQTDDKKPHLVLPQVLKRITGRKRRPRKKTKVAPGKTSGQKED